LRRATPCRCFCSTGGRQDRESLVDGGGTVNVMQVVGYKKTGKTTLTCRLVQRLTAEGIRVGTVKHDGHTFEPDVPNTDSWKHRQAGALSTTIVSPTRTAWFEEQSHSLDEVLERMAASLDLVLVEGWKRERYPKLALVQAEEQLDLLEGIAGVAGIVTWNAEIKPLLLLAAGGLPVFDFDDTEMIIGWLFREGGLVR
jgi:molybdopterin-guanine dinucleotide biosynthesis protein B